MYFLRGKRDGETREEYAGALQVFVQECLSKEFPVPVAAQAATPSLIGAPSTAHRTVTFSYKRYKRTSGAASGHGENFEWKTLTLFFLRLIVADQEFQLASNMDAAGLFDDIVLRNRKHSDNIWRVSFLQLKHKSNKNKVIQKPDIVGISGEFSLVKYCESYKHVTCSENMDLLDLLHGSNAHDFIIYTNADIHGDLVDEKESDQFLITGGKVSTFKAEGQVFREVCELVDFKNTLRELHDQERDQSGEVVKFRIMKALDKERYQNKVVKSWTNELIATPTWSKLSSLLDKLRPVLDKETYSSFLPKFQVYSKQAHESKLDSKIKEELAKVGFCGFNIEGVLSTFKYSVKAWWESANFFLTQDSSLWLEIVKSQTMAMSKSTIDGLSKSCVEYEENSLHVLYSKIASSGGILNLRVDSRTTASSLKVLQALDKLGTQYLNVLHVNIKALLVNENNVISAWKSRWCRVLVVECDTELNEKESARISSRILHVVGRVNEKKLIVLIAPKKHELNVQLYRAASYLLLYDNFVWYDLTEKTRESLLLNDIVINGSGAQTTLADLLAGDKGFVNKVDLEVVSQLLNGDFCCGQKLEKVGKFFITRRLKKSADSIPFTVNSVRDVPGKVVLVVAEPGMGKSTLIKHLAQSAREDDPTVWIVHIKLNDCSQYLEAIDMKHFNEVTVQKFVEQSALSPGNFLEKLLFGTLKNNLVIIVDGVDEVCPHYEKQVFELLRVIKDMEFRQLWVASRPVFQKKLEETLRVETIHLEAFSKDDQKEFFYEAWKESFSPSATAKECYEVIESLLTWLTNSLGEDNPILGVPLMTSMIAETFQERMFSAGTGNVSGSQKTERLDVMSLYKTFVQKKFDVYCVEKKKTQNRELTSIKSDEGTLLKHFNQNHRLAALRVLFSREEIACLQFEGKDKFDVVLETYLREVFVGDDKLGIIDNVIEGKPNFVHRSFAEYFAACWLAENYTANRTFIEQIMFDPSYKLLSEMFHYNLAGNRPLHVSVLNRDLEAAERILRAQPTLRVDAELDDGGRTLLHLAVLLSATDPHPNCIIILEYLIKEHNAALNVADDVLEWTPIRYAEWSGAWMAIQIMLENGGHFLERLGSWQRPDPRLVLDAARDASLPVVLYLAEHCLGPQGETMIHRAAELENVEMLGHLYIKKIPLDITDNNGNTALRNASPQALRYLLERGLNLEAVNKQGLTAFQVVAQNGEYEKMTTFLKENASFQASLLDNSSEAKINTSLLCAAFAGCLKSVQMLVQQGASVDHRDSNGHIAAWVAMHGNHTDVMDWLLLQRSKGGDTPLHAACRMGELDIVSFIVSQRAISIEAKGWLEQTPLITATQKGYLDVVKLLLENGASIDCRDEDDRTPLFTASSEGHKDVVALLLSRGANVNIQNKQLLSPLHIVTLNKKLDIAKLLLENGANVESRDEDGQTPLHTASSEGLLQVARLLLYHGSDVKAQNSKRRTPLHVATLSNKFDMVNLLLGNKAHANCVDEDGKTPLCMASSLGYEQVVNLLLCKDADLKVGDNEGVTPLHAATRNNKLDVVKLLMEKGASVESRDGDGRTPLFTALLRGHKEIVDFLLSKGADVHVKDNKNLTPLLLATWSNKPEVVEMLLEKGAEVECRDKDGWTPLYRASSRGREQVVALLLRYKADVHVTDNKGLTPLHAATANNHLDVATLLVEKGSSVDCCDNDGQTPLHIAVTEGNEQVVSLLLSYGAGVQVKDKQGRTPLMIATDDGNTDVVKQLKEAGASL